jgi:hypothetical protein
LEFLFNTSVSQIILSGVISGDVPWATISLPFFPWAPGKDQSGIGRQGLGLSEENAEHAEIGQD